MGTVEVYYHGVRIWIPDPEAIGWGTHERELTVLNNACVQFGHELQRALHFLRQQYRTYKRSLIDLIPRYDKMRLLSAIGGDMPDFDISKIHAVTYLASNYEKHFSIRWHEGGACWDGQRYVGCLPEGVLKRAQGLRRLEERDKYKGCLAVYWRECKEKVLQKHMDEFEQARQDAQATLATLRVWIRHLQSLMTDLVGSYHSHGISEDRVAEYIERYGEAPVLEKIFASTKTVCG